MRAARRYRTSITVRPDPRGVGDCRRERSRLSCHTVRVTVICDQGLTRLPRAASSSRSALTACQAGNSRRVSAAHLRRLMRGWLWCCGSVGSRNHRRPGEFRSGAADRPFGGRGRRGFAGAHGVGQRGRDANRAALGQQLADPGGGPDRQRGFPAGGRCHPRLPSV